MCTVTLTLDIRHLDEVMTDFGYMCTGVGDIALGQSRD